jgi:hypothetical protein
MNDKNDERKIVDGNNIEKIMKEEKSVYGDGGEIIFERTEYYEYVLDDERKDEEIKSEYLKWFHEFYGEKGNVYNNRFSDKSVIEKFKLLSSNRIMKLPAIIKCTYYFVSDGTKDGSYIFRETDENGRRTDKKTGEYPYYLKPRYRGKEARDEFPNGNMLMASELTGTYGPAIYICKVKRVA